MPETESNATKSRLEKFIDGCSQLTEIYAVTPLDYTNIMGEWWQRINDIIYTLGLTETQNTPVTIAWTVPVPGRKRSPFFEEEIATKKPDGTTVLETSRVSHVAGDGTGQQKAHKYGFIQSVDKLFQRNINTWGSLYEYFYNQIHGRKQPVDLTEMIFGKPSLTDAQIQDIFDKACRNLVGDDQGLANSLKHFIEDVIGSNLYDFLDPNKQTPNNASEPNGLIDLLFGKNADGTPLSINDIRDKWKEMEKDGSTHDGLIGRSNEIVDTIGEELYDWLNDEHACGFVYQSSDPNNQVPYLPTFTLKDILFGQNDPNGNSRVSSWCDMIKNLRSGGIIKEVNNIVNYLGDTYITYVNEQNSMEEDPDDHDPNNPANDPKSKKPEDGFEINPLTTLEKLKNGQVLYGKVDPNANLLGYEGNWILSPGNICENEYEYQQVKKAQNDQEAIFNTFERISYTSSAAVYNYSTMNATWCVSVYPRDISIKIDESNADKVKVECVESPVDTAEHILTKNSVLAKDSIIYKGSIVNDTSYSQNTTLSENLTINSQSTLAVGSIIAANSKIAKDSRINNIVRTATETIEEDLKVVTINLANIVSTYDQQFIVDTSTGEPSLRKAKSYTLTYNKTDKEKINVYGSVPKDATKPGNVFYKNQLYYWIMLPFESKTEMKDYNDLVVDGNAEIDAPFRLAKTCKCRNAYGSDGDWSYFLANRIDASDTWVKIMKAPEDVGETKSFSINSSFLTKNPEKKWCYCIKAYNSNGTSFGSDVYWFKGCTKEITTNAQGNPTSIKILAKTETFNYNDAFTNATARRADDGQLIVTNVRSSGNEIVVYPRNASFADVKNTNKVKIGYTITYHIIKCTYLWDFSGYCGIELAQDHNAYKNWWIHPMHASTCTMDSWLSKLGVSKTTWCYADTPEMSSWNLDKAKNIVDIGTNSITYLAFVSNKKYGQYYFKTRPNSDTNDDDYMGIVVGGYKDFSTGNYNTLSLIRCHNGLSLQVWRYNATQANGTGSESINLPIFSNGIGEVANTLKAGSVIAKNSIINNGSKLQVKTDTETIEEVVYDAKTRISAPITLGKDSTLTSGSMLAAYSTIIAKSSINNIVQEKDEVIKANLYIVGSAIANVNGKRTTYVERDVYAYSSDNPEYDTTTGTSNEVSYQGKTYLETLSGMYGLKEHDTFQRNNTTYNISLRHPEKEVRYVDMYATTGPHSTSEEDNEKYVQNPVGGVGSISVAKDNGKTGTVDGEEVKFQTYWDSVTLIIKKILGCAKDGMIILVADAKSLVDLAADEIIPKIGSSILRIIPFHLPEDECSVWWNSLPQGFQDTIITNIKSILEIRNSSNTDIVAPDYDLCYSIFEQKIWPLYELSTYTVGNLTLDDIMRIRSCHSAYYCIAKDAIAMTGESAPTAADRYQYLGYPTGWGLINAYTCNQLNYDVVVSRELKLSDGVLRYETTITYNDIFKALYSIANNTLKSTSVVFKGSKIAKGSTICVSGTNGTTKTTYASDTVITRNITIDGDSYLEAGSILKAKSIIAANSYIGDKKYAITTLSEDLLVPKDAIAYFRKHYPYPGQLKIILTSETENLINYSVIKFKYNNGYEQVKRYKSTDQPELYKCITELTAYGYMCCSNPLTHFSNNQFIDMDNSDIYVLDTDTHYKLNDSKGYDVISNAQVSDKIFATYGTGRLISNDTTNKVYFTRGDNNTVQKVVDSVKLGPGLVYGENNMLTVDFSNMDTTTIERMLKQIKVPIWLSANTRFYVDKNTGNDYLGSDTKNVNYDGFSDVRGTAEHPFKTIQAAVNYVASTYNMYNRTATIVVGPGIYEESLSLGAYSKTSGIVELEPWNGYWTTTIRMAGNSTISVSGGGDWRVKGFILESYYGKYNDTTNHYMACVSCGTGSMFRGQGNTYRLKGLRGIAVQSLNRMTNVIKAGSVIKKGSYLKKGTEFVYLQGSGDDTVQKIYTIDEPVLLDKDYTLAEDWDVPNGNIILHGSILAAGTIISGMKYEETVKLVVGVKGILTQTINNKQNVLKAGSIIAKNTFLLANTSFKYLANGVEETFQTDKEIVATQDYTLAKDWIVPTGNVIYTGSKLYNDSVLNGKTYNTTEANALTAISVTEPGHSLRGIIIGMNSTGIIQDLSVAFNGLWIRSEYYNAKDPKHVNGTFKPYHTIAKNSVLAKDSVISAGSIITTGDTDETRTTTSYDTDTTLTKEIKVSATSWLMPGSIIAVDSSLVKGCIINGETLTSPRNYESSLTLKNTSHTLFPESRIAPFSYIAAGSIINGDRYTSAYTLSENESIMVTTKSVLANGSGLSPATSASDAPGSLIAKGSTLNDVTYKANTIVQENWKNNRLELERGVMDGGPCFLIEDGGYMRTGATYGPQEYCKMYIKAVTSYPNAIDLPSSFFTPTGGCVIIRCGKGDFVVHGGAKLMYTFVGEADCRRFYIDRGSTLYYRKANGGILGIDTVYNENGSVKEIYNEEYDTPAIIKSESFKPGETGPNGEVYNTYSKTYNSIKLSYIAINEMCSLIEV